MYSFVLFCLLFVGLEANDVTTENPDFSRFIIWGPGLRSDFFMPVRYFYVQAVDTESNKLDCLIYKN